MGDHRHPVRGRRALTLALTLAALAACGGEPKAGAPARDTTATRAAAAPPCPGPDAGITLPDGFCATIFADSLGPARHLAVAADGAVYVNIEGADGADPPSAAVVALRDTSGDGRADLIGRIPGTGNTGIGIHREHLYVDEGARIVRYALARGRLVPAGPPEVVVQGIPLEPGHVARNFVIADDGTLYLNIGSATNACQREDRTPKSPGVDPCTELETRAGLWRFSAAKLRQRPTRATRWATGLRNAMGLAFEPGTGRLWATQHGRDQLRENWPEVIPSWQYSAENPAEELMIVNRGDDFGWPYCYYAMDEKKLVTAPEYGGDGKRAERCAGKREPVAIFPAHWAPMSLLFYTGSTGSQFPARYRQGAFIAFHGSWNRTPEPQAGYRVVFQPLADGKASGPFETFADGFAGRPAGTIQPGNAKHRPVGLAEGPDGALYVSDDAGGRIYRITYRATR